MSKAGTRYAIAVTALFLVICASFPSFPNTVTTTSNQQFVDRAHKTDRMKNGPTAAKTQPHPSLMRAEKRVPIGCDRAFSSMSSSQFLTTFGRCLV